MAGTIAAKSDASTTLGNLYYETGPGGSGIVLGSVILWGTQDSPTNVTSSAGLPVAQQGTWSVTATNAGTFACQDSQVVADNAAFTDGTSKLFLGGFVYDEVAGTALTENDAAAARINVNRAQVHAIEDGSTRGRYATVTASNALKVDNSAVTQPVNVSQVGGASVATGHGTASGALRVELPTDGTGVVGLAAGESHAGAVGGHSVQVSATPTVTASSAYSSGNCVGTSQTLTNACRTSGGAVTLAGIVITDKANQKAALTILILDAAPGGTYTDKSSPTLATDLGKVVAHVTVAASDYVTVGSDSKAVASLANLNRVCINNESGRNLYAVVLATGTPTYASTSDLTFKYKFYQD